MRYWRLLMVLLCCVTPARAAVVMKSGPDSLRVKTVHSRTIIKDGLATTTLVWTFADSARRWKPEVEFFYAAPERGVVSFFAYWFKGERVVARIAERERARAIYSQLTRWGVDPALVELDGKNTFHASIFPVEAGQDVRVEMHIIQPLDATRSGQKWVLPLAQTFVSTRRVSQWIPASKSAAPIYDDVQIDVQCRDKGRVNFPGGRFVNGHWNFQGKNVPANRDFEWELPRTKSSLPVDLSAGSTGGSAGYFSLLLAPNQSLHHPRLSISGVKVFDVFPAQLPPLRAGQNVVVCGRFQAAGQARVELRDGTRVLSAPVRFSMQRGAGTSAGKLWASRKLAALGSDVRNRARVIALSKRWNLPSTQTAWLAVPKSEKVNFEVAKRNAKIQQLSLQVAEDMVLGRTQEVGEGRKQLERLFPPNYGGRRQDWMHKVIETGLDSLNWQLAQQIASEELSPHPDAHELAVAKARLNTSVAKSNRWSTEVGRGNNQTAEELLKSARQWGALEQEQEVATEYVEAVLDEGENSALALRLKKRLDFLQPRTNETYNVISQRFYYRLRVPLHQLAYEKIREENRLNPDTKKIASIESDMKRLLGFMGGRNEDSWLEWQRGAAQRDSIYELLEGYKAEVQKAIPDTSLLNQQRQHVRELRDLYYTDAGYPFRGPATLGGELLDDPAIQAAQKSGDKRELIAQIDRKMEFFARPGDPLIQVGAPRNARSVVALLPDGQIKPLTWNTSAQRWEARFDIPTYAAEGAYAVRIVVVSATGKRQNLSIRFDVDLRAPASPSTLHFKSQTPRLELDCDASTDRVSAFFDSGERVEMARTANGRWGTLLSPALASKGKVRFVLTDAAHNRTEIVLDLEQSEATRSRNHP